MNERVSVIISTFNSGTYIGETIRAILAQTMPPAEIIVIDDGSTDGTPERIVDEFGTSVTVKTIAHSGIPAVVRNEGIAMATGMFIAFCDGDDVWLPTRLSTQLQWMQERNCGLCCSDAFVYGTQQRYLGHHRFHFGTMQKNLAWRNFVITSSVLVRRDALGTNRFPEQPAFRGYEDYLLWLELSKHTSIAFIPEPLLLYRVHEHNISKANKRRDPFIQMKILLFSRIIQRYPLIGIVKTGRLLAAAVSRIWS